MTDMNIAWSILMKGGIVPERIFARRVTPDVYQRDVAAESMIDALVPYGDQVLRYARIESLVQLVLKSDFRDRLLLFDPVNSYEKAFLQPLVAGERAYSLPENIRVIFEKDEDVYERTGKGFYRFESEVAVNTLVTPFGIEPFTVTNGLSSIIEIFPGMRVRFSGPVDGAEFSFYMELVSNGRTDWVALLNTLENIPLKWSSRDLRETWQEDVSWVQRISAVVMSALELSRK